MNSLSLINQSIIFIITDFISEVSMHGNRIVCFYQKPFPKFIITPRILRRISNRFVKSIWYISYHRKVLSEKKLIKSICSKVESFTSVYLGRLRSMERSRDDCNLSKFIFAINLHRKKNQARTYLMKLTFMKVIGSFSRISMRITMPIISSRSTS